MPRNDISPEELMIARTRATEFAKVLLDRGYPDMRDAYDSGKEGIALKSIALIAVNLARMLHEQEQH